MSRQLRTLWLIGFTCAVAAGIAGCETRDAPRQRQPPPAGCVDDPTQRFFNVHWEIDAGSADQSLPPLGCSQAPAATVFVVTSLGQQLEVGRVCNDNAVPIDGTVYNFVGSTEDSLQVGTVAATANLVRDSDNVVISTAALPGGSVIGACSGVDLTVQFPLGS